MSNWQVDQLTVVMCQLTSRISWPMTSTTGVLIVSTHVTQVTWLWRWLPLRLSKHQSMSSQTVLLRTTLTRTIVLHLLMIWLLGSNHLQQTRGKLQLKWRKNFLDLSQPVRTRYIQILGFESHRNDSYGNSPLKRKWTMNMKKSKKTNPNKTGQIKKILDRRIVNLFSFLQHNLWFHSSNKMTK